MVYELHIWGPAFGLPSIDAQCLAIVAYLKQCLSIDEWVVIPSSDPILNPLGQLPALRHGEIWVAGYRNIVNYLREASNGNIDLDKELTSKQQADCIAHTAFIESRGQPLLDLSLYVSSENYNMCTKPALAEILTWPNNWFVPHKLHEKAKKRSEHLGLSGLDVDTAQDDKDEEGLTGQIPRSLRKPRLTVMPILGRDTKRNRFRLVAVTAEFFEPLEEMLSGSKWLVSDSMSSVDCLAMAYLALMRGPKDLPQPWLREAMGSKHPEMEGWVLEKQEPCFGRTVSAAAVFRGGCTMEEGSLAWQTPKPRTFWQIADAVLVDVAEAIPLVGAQLSSNEVRTANVTTGKPNMISRHRDKQRAMTQLRNQRLFRSQLFGSSVVVAIATSLLFWNGFLVLPRRVPGPRTRGFGEAGAMLGLG